MSEPHYAFDQKWFARHQETILWFLNSPVFKYLARWILRIHNDCSMDDLINIITPNSFSYGAILKGDQVELKTDFRTHNKFSKRIYHAFAPVWWTMHFWDWLVADRVVPRLSFGFNTLTAYSTPGSTVSGQAIRDSVNEVFSTIRAGAGNNHNNDVGEYGFQAHLTGSVTTNQFQAIARGIFLYDTSSLTSGATISSAVISLYLIQRLTNLGGTPSTDVVSSTPASDTVLANSDYSQLGSTVFSSIVNTSQTLNAYNDFTLDANGKSNISKTGISKFGLRISWDTSGSFGGTWASGAASLTSYRDGGYAGTASDPKLVITYTVVVGPANVKSYNGLASASVKSINGLAIASVKSYNGII